MLLTVVYRNVERSLVTIIPSLKLPEYIYERYATRLNKFRNPYLVKRFWPVWCYVPTLRGYLHI